MVNSRLEPQGRLAERTKDGWRLAGDGPLHFPQVGGDSTPRFSVVATGPGDAVAVPHLALFERR